MTISTTPEAQEEFIINDILLRINATDIQVFDQKFTDSYSAIRDMSTLSVSSTASLATYVVTLAFDTDNNTDRDNLIKLSTELSKYPFLFIKSQRLEQYIPSISRSINSYTIFAVNEWTLRHDVRANNAIFLTIDLIYFNHTPYIKNFNFISYEPTKASVNSRVKIRKNSTGVTLVPVDNLYESKMFMDYFAHDYINASNKFAAMSRILAKDGTSLVFGSPEIIQAVAENSSRPYEIINQNLEHAGFEDQDIILLSYINSHKTNEANKEEDVLKYWLCYKDLPIFAITDNYGQKVFDVQSISVTRKNNLVANQLQMYREPFIQYLGSSPAKMTINVSINNSEFDYEDFGQDANIKPYEILSNALRIGENYKVVAGNKMPFKSLRVRSALNILADAAYFIVDNESSIESSEDQGRQGVTINLIESDLTGLVGSSNLNLASQSLQQRDLYPVMFIASEFLAMYAEKESAQKVPYGLGGISQKDRFSSLVSDDIRREVEGTAYEYKENPNEENTLLIKTLNSLVNISYFQSRRILSSGINENINIHGLAAFLFIQTDKFLRSLPTRTGVLAYKDYSDGLVKASKALKAEANAMLAEKTKLPMDGPEFSEFYGAVTKTVERILAKNSDSGLFSSTSDKDGFYDVYSRTLKSAHTNLSVKGLHKDFNLLNGEAIPDLDIFGSLMRGYRIREVDNNTKTYLGGSNPQRLSPFFFLNQEKYLDAESLMAMYTAADLFASKDLEKAPLLQVPEYIKRYDAAPSVEDKKQKPAKKNAKYSAQALQERLDRLEEYANLAFSMYEDFRKRNINNTRYSKALKNYTLTKQAFYIMLSIESGGDPNQVSSKGYYGLYQLSKKNWNVYSDGQPFSKWNDPVINTRSAINFYNHYIIPGLLDNDSKALGLNPNSFFNFYMMSQQGVGGWRQIVRLYVDKTKRNSIVPKGELREAMVANFPGKASGWDFRASSWVDAWKNRFGQKTGIRDPQIFGYTEPNATMMTGPLEALNLTTGIGVPANVNKIATITKKSNKSIPSVEDGDTIYFAPKIGFEKSQFNIDGSYDGGKLRIFGIDAMEVAHTGPDADVGNSNVDQKYGRDATEIAKSVLSKMKYPISIYSNEKDVYGRNLAIVIDANGSDFSYEMIKNGVVKYGPSKDPLLIERSALYRGIYTRTKSILEKDNQETPKEGRATSIGGAVSPTVYGTQLMEIKMMSALSDIPKEPTVLERESEILRGSNEDIFRPAEGLIETKKNIAIKPLQIDKNTTAIEFDETINYQYRCMRTGNHISTGLELAVPTVKMYVVEGMRDDFFARNSLDVLRETNLYEVKGLVEVSVQTPTEDNPVSVAAVTVLNPGSIYTDLAAIARRGAVYNPTYQENNLDPNYTDKIGKLRLVAGTRIHIRIGYSNDPNDLENVFNGEITEVEGEDILEIVAEGYGRELIAINHSVDEPENLTSKSASTSLVVHELLQSDEIFHLGIASKVKNSRNPLGRNILDYPAVDSKEDKSFTKSFSNAWSGIYNWLTKPDPNGAWFGDWWEMSSDLYTNVYTPLLQAIDPDMAGDLRLTNAFSFTDTIAKNFVIYDSTIWESLREVQYRHPGTFMSVMNYKQRASLFFGIKEQMYVSEDPPLYMMNGATESFETYDAQVNSIKHKIIKPATDMHLITSEKDIISNQIKLNASFKTKIDVRYFDDFPSREELEIGYGMKYYEAKLDDNLRPNAIRSKTLEAKSCDHQQMAWRYGVSELKRQAEMMYDGKIIIVGNPYIKAGDYAYLSDRVRGLNGIIKIRECSHIINERDGYITSIVPGLFVESTVFKYSHLYTKLGLAFTMAANSIRADASTNFFDTRKIKYTTSFLEIVSNPKLYAKLFSGPFDEGNVGATAAKVGLNITPGIIGGFVLYRSFPWLTSQVISVAAALSTSAAAGAVATAGRFAAAATISTIFGIASRGGLLGTIAGASLVGAGATTAAVTAGMRVALMAAGNKVLARTGVGLIASGILAIYVNDLIEEERQTRQPLILYPLLNNGIPYQVGLFGYEINTIGESFSLEIDKTIKAAEILLKSAKQQYFNLSNTNTADAQLGRVIQYLKASSNANTSSFYKGQP